MSENQPQARDPQDPDADDPTTRGEDQVAERREKATRLRAQGVDPYPVGATVTHALADITSAFADRLEAGEESGEEVTVAGRLVLRRGHGKLVFCVLREGTPSSRRCAS
jgi:lysyl-tRNA synthetase, class II